MTAPRTISSAATEIATAVDGAFPLPASVDTTTLSAHIANNAVYNVRDSLAVGDGFTDDTAGILDAITKQQATGGIVRIPRGTFLMDWTTGFLSLTRPLVIIGDDEYGSVLKLKGSSGHALMQLVAGNSTGRLVLRSLTFDGNRSNNSTLRNVLEWNGGAAFDGERVHITSFNSYGIVGLSITDFRLRQFTMADAAETPDATQAGGSGAINLTASSSGGRLDIGQGEFVQPTLSDNSRGPFGILFEGNASASTTGVIEDLYFERWGHQSSGPNPLGCVDIYDTLGDMTIRGIRGRNCAYSLVKTSDCPRQHISDIRVIGQNHNYNGPAVILSAGTHHTSTPLLDPEVQNVVGFGFTAGTLLHVVGITGSEPQRLKASVRAVGCLQAVLLDYVNDSDLDVIADSLTGTLSTASGVEYGAHCTGVHNIRMRSNAAAVYPIHCPGASITVRVLPGSYFNNSPTGLNHIRCDSITELQVDNARFLGTPSAVILANTIGAVRIRNCDGPSGASVSYNAITVADVHDNSWQRASATYDPPSLATGLQQSTDVSLAGAAVGDMVQVSFSLDLSGTQMRGEVITADSVRVFHTNPTAGTVNIASGTLMIRIRRG